eukprot:gene6174-2789_t
MAAARARGSCLLLSLLALSLVSMSLAEDGGATAEATPLDDETLQLISKMRVKEMKGELAERGLECVACAEKGDVSNMLIENWHLPKGNKKMSPEELKKMWKDLEKKTGAKMHWGGNGMPGMDQDKMADLEKMFKNMNVEAPGSFKKKRAEQADSMEEVVEEEGDVDGAHDEL